jgi:hypothetical protein
VDLIVPMSHIDFTKGLVLSAMMEYDTLNRCNKTVQGSQHSADWCWTLFCAR